MILQFTDNTGVPISEIQTTKSTVFLNLKIDFEDIPSGHGRILKNNLDIGRFSKDPGRPITVDFYQGNLIQQVKHQDVFYLVLDEPYSMQSFLTIHRTHGEGTPILGQLLQTSLQYEYESHRPKILTQFRQNEILELYKRKPHNFKHVALFVKELLKGLNDEYDIDVTTLPIDDGFFCSQGVPFVMGTSDILNNDLVRVDGEIVSNKDADVLEIISINSVVGGTVRTSTFNGKISSITFEDSSDIGQTATFVCVIKNRTTGETVESQVSLRIREPHPITAVNDVFDITQGSSIVLPVSQLLSNDITKNPPITYTGLGDRVVGGEVTENAGNITFQSTGFAGNPAEFQYNIKDALDYVATGTVKLNVLELPELEAYIFNTEELDLFKTSYTPPTLAEVFNSWDRFSNHTEYYPGGTPPQHEAAAWERYGQGFRCTINSGTWTGFVSPKNYTNYVHDCVFSSVAADDDCIGSVVAFKRENNINHTLVAIREPCGVPWFTSSTCWSLAYVLNTNYGSPNIVVKTVALPSIKKRGNWSVVGQTRVRVERIGSMIRATCSQFGSTELVSESLLEIDLNDYSYLSWALDGAKYGYTCFSQQYSTFSEVQFDGGTNADQLLDLTLNCVWNFVNGVWVKDTTSTIQSLTGYPRTIVNPINGKRYRIKADSITEIV